MKMLRHILDNFPDKCFIEILAQYKYNEGILGAKIEDIFLSYIK